MKGMKSNLSGLMKNIDQMKNTVNSSLAQLPPEEAEKIVHLQSDLNGAVRLLKQGDSKGLNDLLNKYQNLKNADSSK